MGCWVGLPLGEADGTLIGLPVGEAVGMEDGMLVADGASLGGTVEGDGAKLIDGLILGILEG